MSNFQHPKPSGKFVVRIPSELHEELRRLAVGRGISLNQICQERLQADRASSQVGSLLDEGAVPGPILEKIRTTWKASLVGVVLFGSVARSEASVSSDVDVLIVLDSKATLTRDLYSEWDSLFGKCESRISPQFVKIPSDAGNAGNLWCEVALEGIVLCEENYRISQFLTALRESMIKGEWVRALSHGHPYWMRSAEAGPMSCVNPKKGRSA